MNGTVQRVAHEVPPSSERRTPTPNHQKALPSPVPQYTVRGVRGSKASAPTVSVAAKSVRGAQLPPRSKLSHTPPAAAPQSTCAGFAGSTAIVEIRPETFTRRDP